jgi:UDP-N-acetylmuramate--alanine ligase
MDEFANAFHDADTLFVLDIYAASEPPIEGITGETLARRIEDAGKQEVRYAQSFAAAAEAVVAQAQQGDMILTLGAGSVSQLGPMILEKLQAKEQMISITREVVATTSPE